MKIYLDTKEGEEEGRKWEEIASSEFSNQEERTTQNSFQDPRRPREEIPANLVFMWEELPSKEVTKDAVHFPEAASSGGTSLALRAGVSQACSGGWQFGGLHRGPMHSYLETPLWELLICR